MNKVPCVSIIIPTFNYGGYISSTLDSIFKQGYQSWECIVVDDGSTDNTSGIVTGYAERDKRVIYIYQKNGGASKARNNGLSRAKGEYIQFLDADDLLEHRKLQCHAQYLENNPEADIVYGSARYFRTEYPNERRYSMTDIDAPWMPEVSGSGKDIQQSLVEKNIMVVSAPLIRRRIIDRVGLFDGKLTPLEDWDYWFRCAINGGRFQYLNEAGTLSLIRWHPNSLSSDKSKLQKKELRLRHKMNGMLQDKPLIEYNDLILAYYDRRFGVELVEAGHSINGMWRLLNASYRSSTWKESFKWAYFAMVAPFAHRRNFRQIVYRPIKESLSLLFRRSE